jgi:glycosyltransferase involved in cell wall biosynthesis
MHIGFFSTQMGTVGGPAVFDQRVLHHLAGLDHRNDYTIYGLTPATTSGLHLDNPRFKIRQLQPGGKWLGVALGMTLELKRRPVDLLHASFVPPPIVPGRFAMTMTCWSQYAEPELYPRAVAWRLVYLLDRGARRASAFFCYTHYLKEKVIDRFGFPAERIFVTPPGIGEEMKPIEDREALDMFLGKLGIRRPYLLFIGSLTRRKNVVRLLEAYHLLLHQQKIRHQLVLVGETLFLSADIFEKIRKLGLESHVVLTGRRSHDELPWFYSGADVYVFPTISEGFGLTPLEAMACGAPVVASNITSVPEVVGDAAILFDPTRAEDIAAAIYTCTQNTTRRKAMIENGFANAAKYSWDDTALKMISAYETIHQAGW